MPTPIEQAYTSDEAARLARALQYADAPDPAALVAAGIGIALTLYMMAILVRWVGPWLELDMHAWWMRAIARITDPLLGLMRRILPAMGPFDWSPVAALVAVWIVRLLLVRF